MYFLCMEHKKLGDFLTVLPTAETHPWRSPKLPPARPGGALLCKGTQCPIRAHRYERAALAHWPQLEGQEPPSVARWCPRGRGTARASCRRPLAVSVALQWRARSEGRRRPLLSFRAVRVCLGVMWVMAVPICAAALTSRPEWRARPPRRMELGTVRRRLLATVGGAGSAAPAWNLPPLVLLVYRTQ